MNTAALLCSVVFFVHLAPAQEVPIKVSPATERYHALRFQSTEPSYGLGKVKALIKSIKPKSIDEDNQMLATPGWNRLSTREKFTYCMLHGELSTQNCDVMPWVVDEERKVFAYPPPFNGGEQTWSDRQRAFLKSQRGEVIRLLRSTIRSKGQVGVNLKVAAYEINADELIPDLIAAYRKGRKDQDILTLLMLLMKDGKYKPFLSSVTYQKLYGKDANFPVVYRRQRGESEAHVQPRDGLLPKPGAVGDPPVSASALSWGQVRARSSGRLSFGKGGPD